MLLLMLLSTPLPTLSSCPSCKSVSGPGPLSGLYQLADAADQRCQDLCAYQREGELYCFETVESGYQTQLCSCVPCAEQCLDMFEAALYLDCGGRCQLAQEPCNGTCSSGTFLCGDLCMDSAYDDQFLECGGACQGAGVPCDNTCLQGWKLCMNGSICVPEQGDMFKDCDGECVAASAPCNGLCQNTTVLCGEECVPLSNGSVTACNGSCQPVTQPCDDSCMAGMMLCNGSCVAVNTKYWTCQHDCLPMSAPCDGDCADGLYLVDGECVETCDLCPDQECLSDSDCQDHAGCLLSGERFFCQCYLGWELDRSNASTLQCPHTGACTPAGEDGCEGAPCYEDGGVSVCPYCNASYQNTEYLYQTGSWFGLDTFTGLCLAFL